MSARSVYESLDHSVWLITVCLAAVVVFGVFGRDSYRTLHLQSARYELQIADSAAERSKGLGGRANIALDQGMLFVYQQPAQQCFWMKDMHFALDIMWLDAHKKVVYIVPNVAPETYPTSYCPPQPARYVIELRAGEATRQQVRPGDTLSF